MKKVKIVCPLLNDINNDDEIPVIVERNGSHAEEVKVTFSNLPIQILFEYRQKKI